MVFDTIAAIATPLGEGGIGIIKISGENALAIANGIFVSQRGEHWFQGSHRVYYGQIVNKQEGVLIDEVLLTVMLAPHSYTREDIVEINCHGGIVSIREILKLVLHSGARLAQPGEFTKRAFLNGRLDLTQAESVIDVIRAKTDFSLKVAVNQLKGNLSKQIHCIAEQMLGILAELEAAIDFPEDEIEERTMEEICKTAYELIEKLNILIENGKTGKVFREGIRAVIVGKPNVGKSSLLNALLREDRAIVTEIAGTTRDLIEETYQVKGIPLRLVDTAGIRETLDFVEKIGVEKTKSCLEDADIILLVVDATQGITREEQELIDKHGEKKLLLIVNKIDLQKTSINIQSNIPMSMVSALTRDGMDALEEEIFNMILSGDFAQPDDVLVSNVRHQIVMEKAKEHLQHFVDALQHGLTPDLTSLELRCAWEAVGEITGESITENLLDRIFSDFCIGK